MAFKMNGFPAHDTPLEKKWPIIWSHKKRDKLARKLGLRKYSKRKSGYLSKLFKQGKIGW